MLILSYMTQQLISNVYTFQNPRCCGFREIFDKNFIRGNKEWINKRNDKHEDADYVLHNSSSGTQCLYKFHY